MKLFGLVIVITTALFAHALKAQIQLIRTSGTTFAIEYDNSSGEYQIELDCYGSPSAVVTLRAIGGSNPIRYIRVRTSEFGTSGTGDATIYIEEAGGTIPHIR